jgi:hypothetical protein
MTIAHPLQYLPIVWFLTKWWVIQHQTSTGRNVHRDNAAVVANPEQEDFRELLGLMVAIHRNLPGFWQAQ